MSQVLADRFRRWFAYEQHSHAQVLSSLESVPPEGQSTPAFARAVSWLGHIVAGRQVWLFRLGRYPQPPAEFFPTKLTLPDLRRQLAEIEEVWSSYLEQLSDADLGKVLEYQSMDGGRFRSTVEDILAQLFGHSSYHRGQIATLVRTAGGQPAITDFIYRSREKVES